MKLALVDKNTGTRLDLSGLLWHYDLHLDDDLLIQMGIRQQRGSLSNESLAKQDAIRELRRVINGIENHTIQDNEIKVSMETWFTHHKPNEIREVGRTLIKHSIEISYVTEYPLDEDY